MSLMSETFMFDDCAHFRDTENYISFLKFSLVHSRYEYTLRFSVLMRTTAQALVLIDTSYVGKRSIGQDYNTKI